MVEECPLKITLGRKMLIRLVTLLISVKGHFSEGSIP